LYKKFGVLA